MIAAPLGQRATMATTTVALAGPACPHSQNYFHIPPPPSMIATPRQRVSKPILADPAGGGGGAGQAIDHSPSGMPVTV